MALYNFFLIENHWVNSNYFFKYSTCLYTCLCLIFFLFYLGIAFTKLNNVMLYPLISCTMAQCIMKLTCSYSILVNLQTACLAILSPLQRAYLSKTFPGLHYFSKSIFAEILKKSIGNFNKSSSLFFILY